MLAHSYMSNIEVVLFSHDCAGNSLCWWKHFVEALHLLQLGTDIDTVYLKNKNAFFFEGMMEE